MCLVFKRLLFAALYVLVDAGYVINFKADYQSAIKQICALDMPSRSMAGILAYLFMALGWLVFAVPTADRWGKCLKRPFNGLLAGAFYGMAVYGTFNFTLNVMFSGWAGHIMMQDLLWGISWSALSVGLYTLFSNGCCGRNPCCCCHEKSMCCSSEKCCSEQKSKEGCCKKDSSCHKEESCHSVAHCHSVKAEKHHHHIVCCDVHHHDEMEDCHDNSQSCCGSKPCDSQDLKKSKDSSCC
jgi:uncharacterized membrane protein